MSASQQAGESLADSAYEAARRSATRLVGLQSADGHWRGDLTADTTLESDFILLQLWLYPCEDSWRPETWPLIQKAAHSILSRQLADGGFSIYAGGPAEINACVKAYVALKLAGLEPSDRRMGRLRGRILELGGVQAAHSYIKINLSLFGLYPREHCPSVPPEALLPPFNLIYRVSSWTRTILAPLAIVQAAISNRKAPQGFTVEELWLPGASPSVTRDTRLLSWRNSFLALDRISKWWERHGSKKVRRIALQRVAEWIIERLRDSDGLAANYLGTMYSIMALDTLGYREDDPIRVKTLRAFNSLITEDGERSPVQPCLSPVRDTALACYALAQWDRLPGPLELPKTQESSPARRAADWLIAREIRRRGDWSVGRPNAEPSGWALGYRNEFYPDVDNTALAVLALAAAPASDPEALQTCRKRALAWIIAMQSRDGGWAAFDPDNDSRFLGNLPFAGPDAMLDPACADITGRALEALAAHGVDRNHPAMRRGVDWLVRRQEPDGSWYGHWGVAYICGTCFALRGLAAAGESDREAHVLRGGEWIRSVQNSDGGWGESCASYENGAFTPAASGPSQTAWAILGLLAGGDADSISVRQGIEYLVKTQRADGSWEERLSTGVGFPRLFYLNYHLYGDYFPMLALSAFVKARSRDKL